MTEHLDLNSLLVINARQFPSSISFPKGLRGRLLLVPFNRKLYLKNCSLSKSIATDMDSRINRLLLYTVAIYRS